MKSHDESIFVYADSVISHSEEQKIPNVRYYEYVPVEAYVELKAKLESVEIRLELRDQQLADAVSTGTKVLDELIVANSRIASLREGIEDIRSLRRINCVDDVPGECEFYLTRDSEES